MKVTKYEHACFTVEKDGKLLIVDPGEFTKALDIPSNVVAVVVTHIHRDHFDADVLARIYDKNPDAILVSLPAIVEKMPDHKSQVVGAGDKITVGPFELEFFGGKHAEIHPSIPLADNVGVLINEKIYYPGDSFSEPHRAVELLALPVSGPWLKLGEVIDFLKAVKPERVFATHNAHNSEAAKDMIGTFMKQVGLTYEHLDVGQSVEV